MTIDQTTKSSLWIPPYGKAGIHLAGLLGAMLWACGSAPPLPKEPEPAVEEVPEGPPEKDVLDTGIDCVKAEGVCDLGICTAEIQNDCETPVTCELVVLGICQSGSNVGNARHASPLTIPAGASEDLATQPDCQDAKLVGTTIEELNCR